MIILSTVFLVCALICFVLDAFKVATRVNLTALGLAFIAAAMLIGRVVIA